jgi:parallel beta-helix repeat protein
MIYDLRFTIADEMSGARCEGSGFRLPLFFLLLSTINFQLSTLAQGSLTPPGAPAATMKTLQQIEPRALISSLPTNITVSGSYYLATNLTGVAGTNGITLDASDVTIDLNGFTLTGVAGSLDGISLTSGRHNVRVHNGTVRNWGGIGINFLLGGNTEISHIKCFGNAGAAGLVANLVSDSLSRSNAGVGIFGTVIRNCEARFNAAGIQGGTVVGCMATGNAGAGISARVASQCTVESNSGIGLEAATASDCSASSNGADGILAKTVSRCDSALNSGNGISADGVVGSNIADSSASSNVGDGIVANQGSTVKNCTVRKNEGNGIRALGSCSLLSNTCDSNGFGAANAAGILVTGTGTRIEANHVTSNDRGIDVDGTRNLVIRNTAHNNGVNYSIVTNNIVGVIVAAPASTTINGSTGGAGIGTGDPSANLSF